MTVALITGAAHRVGRELALGFAAAGYAVAVHYRSSREAADATVGEAARLGAPAAAFPADLSDPAAPASLVAAVLARFGRLSALVHAASPWVEGPVEGVGLADWEAVFSVGPRAAFFLSQAAAPALSREDGSILLVSDVAARKAWPRHVPHAAAKAAIDSLVVNLAVALSPRVRVNGIAPGIVLPPEEMTREEVDRLVARTPLRRRVATDDLVAVAVAMVRNRSLTGQVLAVDAGRSVV